MKSSIALKLIYALVISDVRCKVADQPDFICSVSWRTTILIMFDILVSLISCHVRKMTSPLETTNRHTLSTKQEVA